MFKTKTSDIKQTPMVCLQAKVSPALK